MEDGQWSRAAAYVGLSLVLALAATMLGFAAARGLVSLQERM